MKRKTYAQWSRRMNLKAKAKSMDKGTEQIINNGFIYEPIADEDWVLGDASFGREVVIPSGDWTPYLPTGEEQQLAGMETMSCVSQSACKNIEMIMDWMIDSNKISIKNLKWLKDNGYIDGQGHPNFSGRFVAKMSGTTANGNSLKNVAETIRKIGLVPESVWPFVAGMTWAEYYKYPSSEAIKLGREFLARFQINYEVVPESQTKEGLKYSPLQSAVHAWNGRDTNNVYVRCAGSLNHAISIFKRDALIWIFDHYKLFDSFIKKLADNFNMMDYSYRYLITEKNPETPAPSPYPDNVSFITPCSGYLSTAPGLTLEKGTPLTKEEAFIWVATPKQGESLPQIQYDVNPKKEETGWQMLLKAIKKLLGYGR